MSFSFIYLKTDKDTTEAMVRKLLEKVLVRSDFDLDFKDGLYRLTLPAGQKGQALLQSSFKAAGEDLCSSFRGLIVPMFLERFAPYVDLVPDNSIKYLFELGHKCDRIYEENTDMIADIDEYTLLTVKAYIEAGNSPSLASLRLYVHRNTVTYRIDRFIQQTGIDLKSFPNAVFIYFLILHRVSSLRDTV